MILLVIWALLFAWMAFSCWRAPIGYEDRAGFHYGSVPESDAPRAHRPRGHRRARHRTQTGRHLTA